MKVTIRLRYRTSFGQTLFLCGDHSWFGGGQPERALPMKYVNEEFWEAALDLPDARRTIAPANYYFILRQPDGSTIEDFGGDRKLDLARLTRSHTVILESWNDLSTVENVFSTEPFRKVLLRAEHGASKTEPPFQTTHSFQVKAPLLPKGQTVCLLGSASAMGSWNEASLILLRRGAENGCFRVDLELAEDPFPITYKYGIYDLEKNTFVRYE